MKITKPFRLIICLGFPLLAGGIGSFFTSSALPVWYEGLVKPVLNPPAWIFAPVWTALYIMMGAAAFLVWEKGFDNKRVRTALGIFVFQLLLNAAWSLIFFGLRSPLAAFVEIVIMWAAILWTIIFFFRLSRPAAYLLIPYIAWVSFASYLNFSIWILN